METPVYANGTTVIEMGLRVAPIVEFRRRKVRPILCVGHQSAQECVTTSGRLTKSTENELKMRTLTVMLLMMVTAIITMAFKDVGEMVGSPQKFTFGGAMGLSVALVVYTGFVYLAGYDQRDGGDKS